MARKIGRIILNGRGMSDGHHQVGDKQHRAEQV